MIGVGINENVILDKAEIADKATGVLSFSWREKGAVVEAAPISGFEALAADGYSETTGPVLTMRMFPPLAPFETKQDGTPVPLLDQVKQATDSIAEKKNILFQILSVYMTSDKIKLDIYRGSGLDNNNFNALIIKKEMLQKVFTNLAEDFVALMTPYFGKDEHAVRLLLVCQSATKKYADFRSRFVKDNPFIENALIPIESSKLAFTKHEISKGLNDATPTAQAAADKEQIKEETKTAASVFGQPA